MNFLLYYAKREYFVNYKTKNLDIVRINNDKITSVIRISDVHIMTNLSYELIFKNVRHVIELRLNLISVKIFDDDDFNCKFSVSN